MKHVMITVLLILQISLYVGCVSVHSSMEEPTTDIPIPGLPVLATPAVTEVDGFLKVEAESFNSWDNNGTLRDWVLVDNDSLAEMTGGNAYMAVTPDTRVTHDDELIIGTNFFPDAGTGSILNYEVHFNTPGQYYIWVSCFSTGSEDNGVHVGIDGYWPETSARVQWCKGKNQWTWSSAQRVPENHCGTPNTITLEVLEAGMHTIMFSVREDGFKFDQWLMTLDEQFQPH